MSSAEDSDPPDDPGNPGSSDPSDSDNSDEGGASAPQTAGDKSLTMANRMGTLVRTPPELTESPGHLLWTEYCAVIIARAEAIAAGGYLMLPEADRPADASSIELAKLEYRAGMCPLLVRRVMSVDNSGSVRRTYVEEFRVRDLVCAHPQGDYTPRD
jgi:hypothetical protein